MIIALKVLLTEKVNEEMSQKYISYKYFRKSVFFFGKRRIGSRKFSLLGAG